MKFEDLELPQFDLAYDRCEDRDRVARAVYEQMHAHYEAKLAEAKPAPEWRLPDPPPGQQWHRTDWTEDMLPEGYRPLLLGEPWVAGDVILRFENWVIGSRGDVLGSPVFAHTNHCRTRRPLPAPVEYVPLEPGDVPPGSAVRHEKWADEWALVMAVRMTGVETENASPSYQSLAEHYKILRPGSKTWEPCKKPKA